MPFSAFVWSQQGESQKAKIITCCAFEQSRSSSTFAADAPMLFSCPARKPGTSTQLFRQATCLLPSTTDVMNGWQTSYRLLFEPSNCSLTALPQPVFGC